MVTMQRKRHFAKKMQLYFLTANKQTNFSLLAIRYYIVGRKHRTTNAILFYLLVSDAQIISYSVQHHLVVSAVALIPVCSVYIE